MSNSFAEPLGVAVDGRGNVYVADYGSIQVDSYPPEIVEIPRSHHPPLQFGNIAFAGSETQSMMIHNIGGGALTISPSINGPSYIISGSTCTGGVTAGNSCTLQVQFSPVTIGSHVDILTLQTNGLTNPIVTLHGKAYGVGVKTEGPLEFGTIAFGSTKVLPLTITNVGMARHGHGGDQDRRPQLQGPHQRAEHVSGRSHRGT